MVVLSLLERDKPPHRYTMHNPNVTPTSGTHRGSSSRPVPAILSTAGDAILETSGVPLLNSPLFSANLRIRPPLDPDFVPLHAALESFEAAAAEVKDSRKLILALGGKDGEVCRTEGVVFPPGHLWERDSYIYAERLSKLMLWMSGGHTLIVSGAPEIAHRLRDIYGRGGGRSFDAELMEMVYTQPFRVISESEMSRVPPAFERKIRIGRDLEGCRVGLDLGGTDIKVVAVKDGCILFKQEISWDPKNQADPAYHHDHIMAAIGLASSALGRIDAIGISAAGIYLDNEVCYASLFRNVPSELFVKFIKPLFFRIEAEAGVPVKVVNDGEVTALAAARTLKLEEKAVLGLAMGTSQALGHLSAEGCIGSRLNEACFAPVDLSPTAPLGEWEEDLGVGSVYFSQQAAFRLAEKAGISFPSGLDNAEKLVFLKTLAEDGDLGSIDVFRTIGVYLGYTVPLYRRFHHFDHLLLLGRVVAGESGRIIQREADKVLEHEYPHLYRSLTVLVPDEESARFGQAIAAASLPEVGSRDALLI